MTEEKSKKQSPVVRISERGEAALLERHSRINKNRLKAGKKELTKRDIVECALFNLSVEQGFNY
jgi:hypothetical protein